MRALNSNPNVDNSDLSNFPDGRIKDNTGTGNGTGVNEKVYGDLHQTIAKLMRLYGIIPNGLPDNETNGFQIVDALKSLASKNDYIYPLSSVGGFLSVDIKLANMQNGEYIVCLASVTKTTETQIKGIGATTFAITYSGSFLANEYVRVIKTSGGVSVVRLADATSLDSMVSDFFYLKKANQTQEDAGAIDTVATTPLTNLVAFTKRVIGVDSGDFLATTGRNGLLSMGDKALINGFVSPKNIGFFVVDPQTGGGLTLAVGGDIVSATTQYDGSAFEVVIVLQNAMSDTNYYSRIFLQSQSTNMGTDNNITTPVFKPVSTTVLKYCLAEVSPRVQNVKCWIEVLES
jgi:hypothetical protein